MRVALAFLLVGVAGLPLYADHLPDGLLPGPVERALEGHTLEGVVMDLAAEGFDPRLRVDVLAVERNRTAIGSFDEPLRAEAGESYWHVRLRVANEGGIPLGVYTHHFALADDANVTFRAQTGLRDGIFVMRLGAGEAREGTVVFLVPDDARPERILWTGELASAEAPLPIASSV